MDHKAESICRPRSGRPTWYVRLLSAVHFRWTAHSVRGNGPAHFHSLSLSPFARRQPALDLRLFVRPPRMVDHRHRVLVAQEFRLAVRQLDDLTTRIDIGHWPRQRLIPPDAEIRFVVSHDATVHLIVVHDLSQR